MGWGAKTIEIEDGDGHFVNFEMLRENEIAAAEICHNRGAYKSIPPVWMISLPVSDITETLRRVRGGGGEVIKEDPEANYAVIRDPVGVCIALQAG